MSIAFTQENLDVLKQALLTGVTEVQIGDRVVKYRSQKDILSLIKMIEESLQGYSAASNVSNTVVASFNKGRSD